MTRPISTAIKYKFNLKTKNNGNIKNPIMNIILTILPIGSFSPGSQRTPIYRIPLKIPHSHHILKVITPTIPLCK